MFELPIPMSQWDQGALFQVAVVLEAYVPVDIRCVSSLGIQSTVSGSIFLPLIETYTTFVV